MAVVAPAASRLRGAVKSALYSGPRRDRWQQPDRVMETLAVEPGERVADLGSGGGYFTYRLARAVGPTGVVYAVDADADMIARIDTRAARKGYRSIRTVVAGHEPPLLPEPVDLVLCVDSFHHLPTEPDYYARWGEQLTAGGRVAILEPVPRWYWFGHATPPERIREVLTEAGYRCAGEHSYLLRQSFMIFHLPASAE